jgi:hypothetical protein
MQQFVIALYIVWFIKTEATQFQQAPMQHFEETVSPPFPLSLPLSPSALPLPAVPGGLHTLHAWDCKAFNLASARWAMRGRSPSGLTSA